MRGIIRCANQHLTTTPKGCKAQLDILVGSIYTVGTSPDITLTCPDVPTNYTLTPRVTITGLILTGM
jgi:hypothetical protein